MAEKMKAVVVGAGYWGPNLARNFRASADWDLAGICDLDEDRAQAVANGVGGVPVWTRLDDVLADPDVDAIAIATPARTHHPITLAALDAGKHVMVEKPLADTIARILAAPAEVPIGILTAAIGAPFFLFILLRQRALIGS